MSIFPADMPEDALFLSRSDKDELLGTHAPFSFQLEGKLWPTAEHYYQGMKFLDEEKQEQVRAAETPAQARSLGRKRHKSFRKDWKKIRQVVMTRAIYTRCKTTQALADTLLATGKHLLVESSNYDYFWGCGRDRRGANNYGKVLMNVRQKLTEELTKTTL